MTPRMRAALALAAALVIVGPASAWASGTPRWSNAAQWCQIKDRRIVELSGITRSTYHRGLVFVHNDSGDSARFFAVNHRGATRAVFRVRNAPSNDWEDAASGPHHTLWFGDIGDNTESRPYIDIIRVREPKAVASRTIGRTVFRLRYPDGAHNAEALMVRPGTGRVFVVTKSSTGGTIYRAPRSLTTRHVNRLRAVASAPVLVTGGDFAPRGHRFVLRNYSRAYLYRRIGGRPRVIDLPSEQQGEAIGFTRRGNALKLGSEGLDQPVWLVHR
jgi:hypothetical protein